MKKEASLAKVKEGDETKPRATTNTEWKRICALLQSAPTCAEIFLFGVKIRREFARKFSFTFFLTGIKNYRPLRVTGIRGTLRKASPPEPASSAGPKEHPYPLEDPKRIFYMK